MGSRGIVLSIIVAAAGLALCASQAQGAVLAANGFEPDPNGYSFPNYGDDGETNLRPAEMQKLFGERVCVDGGGPDGCVLTPEAESWMDATNAGMSGGHCYGMASTAQFFFDGIGKPPNPVPFGAGTTFGLNFAGNEALQAHIAYAFTLQTLPAVAGAQTTTTPTRVFKRLKESLEAGSARYVLTIYDDGGGHAITPVAVEDNGGGKRRIAVYDNNHPDQTRYVQINARTNKWRYDLGGTTVWSGDAETRTLQLADPRVGLGRQPCFICPSDSKARTPGKSVELRISPDPRNGRHGSIEVTDRKGRKSGCGPKGCVNEIRGAKLRQVASGVPEWRTDSPPVIQLPTRNAYRIALGSTSKRGQVRQGVSVLGRGFSVGAEGIRIKKGERDRIKIRRDVRSIAYKNDARGTESPTLVLTSSNSTGPETRFDIEPASLDRKAQIAVRFDPRGKLRISNRGGQKVERAKVTVTEYSAQGAKQQTAEVKVKRGKGKTVKF